MAARVITTHDAEQDIADAADWYARDRPGREVKFLTRVNECMTTIGRVPRGGRWSATSRTSWPMPTMTPRIP
jgi:hypothetical protein